MTKSAAWPSHISRAEKLLASRAAELTAARDEAMTATRAKNTFLSSTSHELRTPLNSILGFTQLLQMSELSDEDRDGVERILGAGRHLLTLINELIDIARIESGDLSLSLEPVLVRPLIEESSQLMAPIAAERSIRIIQDCAPSGPGGAGGPAAALPGPGQPDLQRRQVQPPGGTITIPAGEEDTGQASVVVSDTGPGSRPKTSSVFSSPSSVSAPSRPWSRAPGSGCRWPGPSPRPCTAS